MKIYTKTGDKGTTSLINDTIVPKDDLRVTAYGSVDELNAYIGFLRDISNDENIMSNLLEIQKILFIVQTLLAVDYKKPCKISLPEMQSTYIDFLEKEIDYMESTIGKQNAFIIPGGHTIISQCHITRCVCRRAERHIVTLQKTYPVDTLILQFINRLSDYFFILSRYIAFKLNIKENTWEK